MFLQGRRTARLRTDLRSVTETLEVHVAKQRAGQIEPAGAEIPVPGAFGAADRGGLSGQRQAALNHLRRMQVLVNVVEGERLRHRRVSQCDLTEQRRQRCGQIEARRGRSF